MRFTQAIKAKLVDWAGAERWRANADQRIDELQQLPMAGATVITGQALPNATDTWVQHGLGREPVVLCSPPYPAIAGVGAIHEVRGSSGSTPIDRTQSIVLRADGYGVTVTVDVVLL